MTKTVTLKLDVTVLADDVLPYAIARGYQKEVNEELNPVSEYEFAANFLMQFIQQDLAAQRIAQVANSYELQKQAAVNQIKEAIKQNYIKSEIVFNEQE